MLFLSRPEQSAEYTTLDLQNGKVYFQSGEFFYIGMSLIRASILSEIPAHHFYDLANTFRKLSQENRLDGFVFPGEEVIDLGDKEKYIKLADLK